MNNTSKLLHNIVPLLEVSLKQADRHGLDEIRISKARVREILQIANDVQKELKVSSCEPKHFEHLDKMMFGINAALVAAIQ